MDWNPYKRGHLAKASHGYYSVYEKFNHELGENRWLLEYELGTGVFAESGIIAGNVQGYRSLEEAQRAGQEVADA